MKRLALAVTLLTACGSGGGAGPSGSRCAALRACCSSLPTAQQSACNTQANQAQASSAPDTACDTLLDGYHRAALCGTVGTTPMMMSMTGSGQPAICTRYVSCVTLVTPSAAAATLAAYGPDGTCWQSGTSVASDCTQACQLGVTQLRASAPAGSACAKCATDTDCKSPTPACDAASGNCVTCTADKHCSGTMPACNLVTQKCVECNTNADCTANASPFPFGPTASTCSVSTHTCVGCTSNSDCSSGVCYHNDCCQPQNACQFSNCGMQSDGCGRSVNCGTCTVGVCDSGRCSTTGLQCTVGVTQCATGEKCMFSDWRHDYRCAPMIDGSSCTTSDPQACGFELTPSEYDDPYLCGWDGKCHQLCLSTSECPSGKTCKPIDVSTGTISASDPGNCL
jgi:hypothetical protein